MMMMMTLGVKGRKMTTILILLVKEIWKKKSQHLAIKIEKKKDEDIFNAFSEGDLKKKMS